MQTTLKRLGIAVGAVSAAVTLALSGCSALDALINRGGDTTCGEFNGQDDQKQNSEVAAMLKARGGTEASNLEVTATRVLVQAFCKTIGKDSSKISEVDPR